MTMVLVAFPMNDDKELFDGHFGDAPSFFIYRYDHDALLFLEKRLNAPFEENEHDDHHGDPEKFKHVMQQLQDVQVLAAFRMGPNYLRIKEKTQKHIIFTGTKHLKEAQQKVLEQLRENPLNE